MKRLVTTLIATLAIAIAGTGTAYASGTPDNDSARADHGLALAEQLENAPNPEKIFDGFSNSDRADLRYALTPVDVVLLEEHTGPGAGHAPGASTQSASTASPLASGCWHSWKRWGAQAAAGNTLYTWWQGLDWCGNGSTITSYDRYDRGGETSTPGWSYVGPAGANYHDVGWEVRSRTQEEFKLTVGPVTVQNPIECGQIRGGASGLTHSSTSCSL